jgi:hypothetical protein
MYYVNVKDPHHLCGQIVCANPHPDSYATMRAHKYNYNSNSKFKFKILLRLWSYIVTIKDLQVNYLNGSKIELF